MSERMFRVTYTGDDVCAIPKVGVFQNGTTAVVDEAGADAARAQGKFSVVALSGDGAAPPAKASAAPAAAEKPAEKQESEKAEKHEKHEKQGKGGKDKPEAQADKDKGGEKAAEKGEAEETEA